MGKAYSDTDYANYNVSSGTYTAWNSGWVYRNDGVDIEASNDGAAGSNGYSVGWTNDNEWLQYTADVDSTAAYDVMFRYALSGSGAKIKILMDDADITGTLSLTSTGGFFTWANFPINDVIIYSGQHKFKVVFEKGGANFSFINFTLSKRINEVPTQAVSAETYQQTEAIYLNINKMLVDSTVSADNFTCTVNGNNASIPNLVLNTANHSQVIITLGQQIFDIDDIKLSYTGGQVKATDGTPLQDFSNLQVKNNLPVYLLIPGKIEAEAFSVNQGLALETTTDIGGGQNVGYTNTGDYLEYRVRVLKTAKYTFEVRAASLSVGGKIEVQQINSAGTVVGSVIVTIPVTGGWQTWKTVSASIDMIEGVGTLKVKILQPEFNMNWYKFTDASQGIEENESSHFSVYPNPANEDVTVQIPGSAGVKKNLNIRSVNGIKIHGIEISETEVSKRIFVGDLPAGLYIIELEIKGSIFRNKLIVQ
jgi:hypothetical protein